MSDGATTLLRHDPAAATCGTCRHFWALERQIWTELAGTCESLGYGDCADAEADGPFRLASDAPIFATCWGACAVKPDEKPGETE